MEFNLNEYFCPVPGSAKEKNIVIFARRHWISFLGDIIVSVMLLIIPTVVIIVAHIYLPSIFQGKFNNFIVIIGSIYYLILTTFIFSAWISYYYDIYILTGDLIADITQKGFFNRKISQLSLLRVQDVSSKIDGLFPTMFAYGDVLVETAGESVETFLLRAIPNPQAFSAKVLELHDQLIEREGRHHQILEAEGTLTSFSKSTNAQENKAIDYTASKSPTPIENSAPPQENVAPDNSYKSEEATKTYLPQEPNEGEIKKDDLDQGGEVQM